MKIEKIRICTRCMEYVPVDPGNIHSVDEVQMFGNAHFGHPTVYLPIKELDTRVYKRFKRKIHGLNRRLQRQ